MSTPDVTTVQKLVAAVITLLGSILLALPAFGLEVTTEQSGAVLGVASALGGVFVLADAIIRNGRSKIAATQLQIDYSAWSLGQTEPGFQFEAEEDFEGPDKS